MKYNRFRKKMDDILLEDANQRYEETISKWENHIDSNCISMAQSLHEVVRLREYTKIEEILDKMVLPTEMKLEVEDYNKNTRCDSSKLRLSGHLSSEDLYDFLVFENSFMGAWQAFLLCTVQHCLPKWWHANYGERFYLFSKDDFKYCGKLPFSQEYIERINVAPELYFDNGRYYISCCYWTRFGGLTRDYIELSFDSYLGDQWTGIISSMNCFRVKTIYSYDCHIWF